MSVVKHKVKNTPQQFSKKSGCAIPLRFLSLFSLLGNKLLQCTVRKFTLQKPRGFLAFPKRCFCCSSWYLRIWRTKLNELHLIQSAKKICGSAVPFSIPTLYLRYLQQGLSGPHCSNPESRMKKKTYYKSRPRVDFNLLYTEWKCSLETSTIQFNTLWYYCGALSDSFY